MEAIRTYNIRLRLIFETFHLPSGNVFGFIISMLDEALHIPIFSQENFRLKFTHEQILAKNEISAFS